MVPAVLVIVGFVILRWLDGQWWGVMLWVLAAPIVYLAVDFLFFGRLHKDLDAKRRRRIVPSKAEPLPHPGPGRRAAPEWKSARETSTGGEILRRGRRYDRRRA